MQPTTSQTSILTRFTKGISARWNSKSHSGSIFRNMAMLASGTVAAKAIGVVSVPVITRIYLPEHFGVLAVFTALTALLVPFGTLRYSMALPLPKRDGTALNLAVLCASSLLIVSILVTLVFWLTAPYLLELLSMQQLLPFWWLLPVAIAGTGMYELLTNWAVREKAFKPLARTKVWQAIIGAITKISLGLMGLKPLGLLIGQVFTQAGGIFTLSRAFAKKIKTTWQQVSTKRIWFLFRRYADFPKYRLPSQFLLIVSTKAPLFYFAWQFGAETTGQLGLALTMLALPMTLFGQTTGQAYYAEIAKIGKKNPEKIYQVTKSITKKLFLISIVPFLILVLGGPWLFQVVFGEVWREAGVFASILAINLLPQFITAPVMNVLNVFDNQKYYLQNNLMRIFLIGTAFTVSKFMSFGSTLTLFIYVFLLTIHRCIVYLRITNMLRKRIAINLK